MGITFSFLALAGFALHVKNNSKALSLLTLLLIFSTGYFLLPQISPEFPKYALMGMIGIFLTTNFIVGSFLENKWARISLPFLSVFILYFIGNKELAFNNYPLDFTQLKILALPLLGYLVMVTIDLKLYFIEKYFPEVKKAHAERTVAIILIGIFSVVATFLASWYGFFLMALGAFAYNCYSKNNRNYVVVALLLLSTISSFMDANNVEAIDLSIGKVIAGLGIGVGAASLGVFGLSMNNKVLGIIISLLGAVLMLAILMANNIHPAYGGIEAFLAAMVGFAFAILLYHNAYIGTALMPIMLIVGMYFANDPFAKATDKSGKTADVKAVEKEGSVSKMPEGAGQDWSTVKGSHAVDSKSSVISFQLGPKGGITKGEIKQLKGTVVIAENLEESSFSLELPVKGLTTFNEMRDESLMEDIYFNEPKFPLMTFKSTSMIAKEDGYILKGEFKLLGKTNPQEVEIKFLGEKDGKLLFVGAASLDKTTFGMASSPQEGDIVDFTFQLLLIK